jgi:hypothetical protein
MASQSDHGLRQVLICALALGSIAAWASLTLRFATRADAIHNLSAILDGQPLTYGSATLAISPFYNRIMLPVVHRAAVHLIPGLSPGQWYLLLRIATFELAFAMFALTCHRALRANPRDTCMATACLTISVVTSFCFPWEDPSDTLDLFALSAGVLLAIEGRFVAALLLAMIFAANRESAAFCGIIWFFLSSRPGPWSMRALQGGAMCAASYAVALAIRAYVAGPGHMANWVALSENGRILIRAIAEFVTLNWLALLAAIGAIYFCTIDRGNPKAMRFVVLAALFVVPGVIFGKLNELRIFQASFLMLSFAVAESGLDTRNQGA